MFADVWLCLGPTLKLCLSNIFRLILKDLILDLFIFGVIVGYLIMKTIYILLYGLYNISDRQDPGEATSLMVKSQFESIFHG